MSPANTNRARSEASTRLIPFPPGLAPLVSSWIAGDDEAYWLAPHTPPPISANRVRGWALPGHEPLLLMAGESAAVAYGELNVLAQNRAEYWVGHLVVDPARRGEGFGRALTQALCERAFRLRGALSVSLVVFPENETAIRCYRACGFCEAGTEWHSFTAYRRRVAMLRMVRRFNA